MRPDAAAFRELDTLVRNLTDQLAGYRRRALAAEARARDLEQQVVVAAEQLAALRARGEAARAEGRPGAVVLAEAGARGTPEGGERELSLENARLRSRLSEARERTTQLGERLRFLRQQVASGGER